MTLTIKANPPKDGAAKPTDLRHSYGGRAAEESDGC